MAELIPKHGGYKNLISFQTTEIIYDLTVEFCKRYIDSFKMKDQLEGAARSGSQNIGEGSKNSGTSKQTEIRLVDVARGSQEELLLDMQAFLRRRQLPIWDKNNPRALEIRALGYMSYRSYRTYMTYMSNPETAANCLICLINQANYLLDKQLATLKEDLVKNGDFKERYKEARKQRMLNINQGPSDEEFLKSVGLRRLENGRCVKIESGEK